VKIMDKLKISSYLIFIISVAGIAYALLFNPPNWIVYAISIIFIPAGILSFGLIVMKRGPKEDEESKNREPFIGY
jgi:energy-converting hydrogenase A subunit I